MVRELLDMFAEDDGMEIQWRRDADAAIKEAKAAGKPLLLDFSAAPM